MFLQNPYIAQNPAQKAGLPPLAAIEEMKRHPPQNGFSGAVFGKVDEDFTMSIILKHG